MEIDWDKLAQKEFAEKGFDSVSKLWAYSVWYESTSMGLFYRELKALNGLHLASGQGDAMNDLLDSYFPPSSKKYKDLLLQGATLEDVKHAFTEDVFNTITISPDDPGFDNVMMATIEMQKSGIAAFNSLGRSIINLYEKKVVEERMRREARELGIPYEDYLLQQEFKILGNFQPAYDFERTSDKIQTWIDDKSRKNTPPPDISPNECRIGLSRFMVPPIAIDVNQSFQTGALAGAALRQQSPPKFNSGYSETTINMTIYFPSDEAIWGFEGDQQEVDITRDGTDDAVIDRMCSSLRGLIAQFKYAPFLPIKNAYLNGVFGIQAVGLQSLTLQTIPSFPFCVAAQLTLVKFDHKVYLPMIDSFDRAIHWGRFRQYMGRAMAKLADYATKDFAMNTEDKGVDPIGIFNETKPLISNMSGGIIPDTPLGLVRDDFNRTYTFNKRYEWQDTRWFDIYFPDQDPAYIVGPDLSGFVSETDPSAPPVDTDRRSSWEKFLAGFGIDVAGQKEAGYDLMNQVSSEVAAEVVGTSSSRKSTSLGHEGQLLRAWLNRVGIVMDHMNEGQLEEYVAIRIEEWKKRLNHVPSQQSIDNKESEIRTAWFATMFAQFTSDPYIQAVLQYQERRRGWISIKEWEVPMRKLGLDHNAVHVQSVTVTMGNALAKLQLEMQPEPVFQHVGGMGSTCSINMIVFGEEEVTRIQKVFETINGLARLEHNHAVLGFLGIKNTLTALAGMKYVLPVSFNVQTIPNQPHTYNVTMELTDFDVLQQKREALSSEQQAQLIEAFGKRNPFLRITQLWGFQNCYPDFPLDIRDNQGNLIGNLDPDFYFLEFKPIDDDIVNYRDEHNDPNSPVNHDTKFHFGKMSRDGSQQTMMVGPNGFMPLDDKGEPMGEEGFLGWNEAVAANIVTNPAMAFGMSPPSKYLHPHKTNYDTEEDKPVDPVSHYDRVLKDTQFRDKSGRMIRAFPTYMLWLIDEGGRAYGMKLFDNLYGLQSVIDFSIVSSEDILGDTLVLRISNLYSRLSTEHKGKIDEKLFPNAALINNFWNQSRNLISGTSNYLVKLDTAELRPGVRVHLRMGYSANPNALDTVFNGTVTEVQYGEVLTVTCQSDAIELGAIVDNKNKDSDSGHIDGGLLTGYWLSEPRDLMVRLLTMGSSVFREQIAYATGGMIFSENRFGIRHFGSMIYGAMGSTEQTLMNQKADSLMGSIQTLMSGKVGAGLGSHFMNVTENTNPGTGLVNGLVNNGVFDLVGVLWANLMAKRDYEIFKRNIYPGNGLGIAQYLGGDLGDGGPGSGFFSTGVDSGGDYNDPITGQKMATVDMDPQLYMGQVQAAVGEQEDNDLNYQEQVFVGGMFGPAGGVIGLVGGLSGINGSPGGKLAHVALQTMGLSSAISDDDLDGFDEVSFRAQTYMKSVWDLFLVCAGLLPNYIVAVRPFMERSTIFYGKPHWMYTSGVIPITLGISEEQAKQGFGPQITPPDKGMQSIIDAIEEQSGATGNKAQTLYSRLTQEAVQGAEYEGYNDGAQENLTENDEKSSGEGDSDGENAGPSRSGLTSVEQVLTLPTTHPGRPGVQLPYQVGKAVMGRHYTKVQGDPLDSPWLTNEYLTANFSYQEDSKGGKFGTPHNSDEQFYIAMPFKIEQLNAEDYGTDGISPWASSMTIGNEKEYYDSDGEPGNGLKISVYNPTNGKILVCTPIDITSESAAILSPDAFTYLAADNKTDLYFGLVDDRTPPGPARLLSLIPASKETAHELPSENENTEVLSITPGWFTRDELKEYTKVEQNPFRFHFRFGAFLEKVPPVWLDATGGNMEPIGQGSRQVFEVENNGRNSQRDMIASGFSPITAISPAAGAVAAFAADIAAFGYTGRGIEDAQEIWDEFRRVFPYMDKAIDAWNSAFGAKGFQVPLGGVNPVTFNYYMEDFLRFQNQFAQAGEDMDKGIEVLKDFNELYSSPTFKYYNVMMSFMQFMWQNPYNRGWLVKTADKKQDTSIIGFLKDEMKLWRHSPVTAMHMLPIAALGMIWTAIGDIKDYILDTPRRLWDAGVTIVKGAGNFAAEVITLGAWDNESPEDAITRKIKNLTADSDAEAMDNRRDEGPKFDLTGNQKVLTKQEGDLLLTVLESYKKSDDDLSGDEIDKMNEAIDNIRNPGTYDTDREWEFTRAYDLFQIYITQGKTAAITWMIDNSRGGKEYETGLFRAAEEAKRRFYDPIADLVTSIGGGIAAIASQLLQLIRFNMMSMRYGLGQAGVVQRQATLMNRALNDSIYYQGTPGTLFFLCDNPFTREYGEPVVEIRQPFQRLHHINSFQHILANGIIETTDQVATVVTATSNGTGDHPITVYFDKGVPTERQVEKSVDTGLFWDKPSNWFGNILHPISTWRGWTKKWEGASDELSSRRIACWHLKESLKDIYDGEIILLGDPSIRPHDLVYMNDTYERMYGLFEVEQVVHHFTPETGFITSITPNALVMINDPGKWNLQACLRSAWRTNSLRNMIRKNFGMSSSAERRLYALPGQMDLRDMENRFEAQLGDITYTGGSSKLVVDMFDAMTMGIANPEGTGPGAPEARATNYLAALPMALGPVGWLGGYMAWKGFEWAQRKLADQHSAYIMYLTKDGMPMDAGLSYNHGVAVGQQRTASLFSNVLRVPLENETNPAGPTITANDILNTIGWNDYQVNKVVENVDYWQNETRAKIVEISGRGRGTPSPFGLPFMPPRTALVTVDEIMDGDTFTIVEGGIVPSNKIRLAHANAAEIPHPMGIDELQQGILQGDKGVLALYYTKKKLKDELRERFGPNAKTTVAIRWDESAKTDKFGRLLAFVFYAAPGASSEKMREEIILRNAKNFSQVAWDGFDGSGVPYTLNWDLVVNGYANIDDGLYSSALIESGAEGVAGPFP